jgi:5-formyltetrahydrofolate cyclo-ligase
MAIGDDPEDFGAYASPPCFLHELDPGYLGLVPPLMSPHEVAIWRKADRRRLITARLAMSAPDRAALASRIAGFLDALLADVAGQVIAVYWPFRGEPDLRPWMDTASTRGARCALPVVIERHAPLAFRTWRTGEPLDRGLWDIRVPRGGEAVIPSVIIAPLVGFDPNRYRLGSGGGCYDRTLAALRPRPRSIGVGSMEAAIATIHPQPHDIPMDTIVTENGIMPP